MGHFSSTRYTTHLVVEALSGYTHGMVRQRGRLKRVYQRLRDP